MKGSKLSVEKVLKDIFVCRLRDKNEIPKIYSKISFKNGKEEIKGKIIDIIGNIKSPYVVIKAGSKKSKEKVKKV